MAETQARWEIAAAILSTGVTRQVAYSQAGINAQLREDLATRLSDLIERKALQETDGGYDLHRSASGESACGWARALSKAGVQSALRDIRLHTNRNIEVDPILDLTDESSKVSYADATFHLAGVEDDLDPAASIARAEELQAIEDDFTEAASGRRSSGRLRIVADALLTAFALPAAVRPEDFMDREWIREAVASRFELGEDGEELELNIDSARNSAAALLAFIMEVESEEQLAIDQRLLDLWDDYSAEELQALVSKPARVAQTLALAAVSAAPRPSRDTMSMTLRTIRLADEDTDAAGFKTFTKRLLDAWVATEAEATNEFDSRSNKSPEAVMEAAALRMTAALDWPIVAAEAAARPGQPFGKNVAEVNAFISSVISTVSR
tara:strand:- start:11053 stop:12195 length:1143 start_codon:yes stop_codon:yes gene_type:complete